MITVSSNKEHASFSILLRHSTVLRTQPVRFAFRAPTGKQVHIRKQSESPYYTLLFGLHGEACVQSHGCSFFLFPNSLLLLGKDTSFAIMAQENANVSFLALEFEIAPEDFVFDLTANHPLYLKNAKPFQSILEEIVFHSIDGSVYGDLMLLTLIEKLLHAKMPKDDPKNIYRHTVAYIRRHLADPPTSALISFGIQYSIDHLTKLLKKSYGLSLSELIKRERLKNIKSYLRFTSYTPERIASILAFSSASAMLAFFRYHTKMSPNEYKKCCQNERLLCNERKISF